MCVCVCVWGGGGGGGGGGGRACRGKGRRESKGVEKVYTEKQAHCMKPFTMYK